MMELKLASRIGPRFLAVCLQGSWDQFMNNVEVAKVQQNKTIQNIWFFNTIRTRAGLLTHIHTEMIFVMVFLLVYPSLC